jgi:hypothetical protein
MGKLQLAPKRPAEGDSLDEKTVRLLKERRDDPAGPDWCGIRVCGVRIYTEASTAFLRNRIARHETVINQAQ